MRNRVVSASVCVLVVLLITGPASATPIPGLSEAYAAKGRGFDEPYRDFASQRTTLRPATPEEAGLHTPEIDTMLTELRGLLEKQGDEPPVFPGAVVLAAHDGKVAVHEAMGHAVKYADADGTELPAALPHSATPGTPASKVPMTTDTIFDLASVTKLFTSIVVMQQVERGRVELDAPVATYLPAFAAHGKTDVTVQDLLTHTSGLPAWLPLWRDWPDRESRIRATLEVKPDAPPGTAYTYSDLNLITLGVLAETVSGESLDTLVREGITEPLGMVDTGFNPPASKLHRIAATEYQADPPRGMVRGSVHDENAWSLGGVAGHAGIFSTAADLARLGQAVLNGGAYDGARILRETTVEQMQTDFNAAFPGNAHGLGFELAQRWYMGGLTSPSTAGHTGFTGTSVVIDPLSRSFVILLTNRVHPSRSWSSTNGARRLVAQQLAQALSVTARRGPTAWYAGSLHGTGGESGGGVGDDAEATLTLPVELRSDRTRLAFDLFVDSEETDLLIVELSRDDGATWEPVPFVCRSRGRVSDYDGTISGFTGRRWQQAYAELEAAPGSVLLRWRYVTDPAYQGRGVYVDDVRLADPEGLLLDAEQAAEEFDAAGWILSPR